LLRVENLKAGPQPPLTFEVADGECLAVEAPSGAGKTSLLRAIADLDPAPGQVFLDGAERSEMPAPQWRKMVRLASSEPGWWTENARAAFPVANDASERGSAEYRLRHLLSGLGLEARHLDQPLATLSTGERARLAFARALFDEPRVLLLDEPTAALDSVSAALVEELIKYQLLAGRSVILISHDAAQIARLAHARLILPAPRQQRGPAGSASDGEGAGASGGAAPVSGGRAQRAMRP